MRIDRLILTIKEPPVNLRIVRNPLFCTLVVGQILIAASSFAGLPDTQQPDLPDASQIGRSIRDHNNTNTIDVHSRRESVEWAQKPRPPKAMIMASTPDGKQFVYNIEFANDFVFDETCKSTDTRLCSHHDFEGWGTDRLSTKDGRTGVTVIGEEIGLGLSMGFLSLRFSVDAAPNTPAEVELVTVGMDGWGGYGDMKVDRDKEILARDPVLFALDSFKASDGFNKNGQLLSPALKDYLWGFVVAKEDAKGTKQREPQRPDIKK